MTDTANIAVAMANSHASPTVGNRIGARMIMPRSCEPVTAMLNMLFAAMSCSFGTTDGTVTASVVPKNWPRRREEDADQDQQ